MVANDRAVLEMSSLEPGSIGSPSHASRSGSLKFDARNSLLEWTILLIDNSNRSGSMEFVVPPTDSSAFFPISVRFSATSTYSDLKVVNILPLRGGAPPKFSQRTTLITENYQVVELTRYCMKYQHCDGKLVLNVTDDNDVMRAWYG